MKKYMITLVIFLGQFFFAQNVVLNKVVKINENTDKIFYKIDTAATKAEYLGEVEVQGFSDDDAKVFGMIYKKAKEIGANAFSYKPLETITGDIAEFDPMNYRLNLYYTTAENIPAEKNFVYLLASSYNDQAIDINKKKVTFEPRTYTKLELVPGEEYTISTRKFLGSAIKLTAQENQPVQYFQFSAFSVNSNKNGMPGINLKSGDITKLERSYAEFITTVYTEFK